jgi:gamma-D-glutamyl-L-lysine dipeptidyl-peptidase
LIIDNTDNAYKVRFPDGREAFVAKNNGKTLEEWQKNIQTNPENIAKAARKLMGVPYLWGGTSFKGVDCSGLTKMAYLQNGITLQRDASQQVNEGILVDDKKNWVNLKAGDLLFFGKQKDENTKEKVSHVGIWLGKNLEFIHSSGRVKVGSFDAKAPNYDEYNLNRYLRTKRILKETDKQ